MNVCMLSELVAHILSIGFLFISELNTFELHRKSKKECFCKNSRTYPFSLRFFCGLLLISERPGHNSSVFLFLSSICLRHICKHIKVIYREKFIKQFYLLFTIVMKF